MVFVIADMIPIAYSLYTPILMYLTEKGIAMREQARFTERASDVDRESFSTKRKVVKTNDNTNVSVIAPLLTTSSSSEDTVHYTSSNPINHSLMHNNSSSTSPTSPNYVVIGSGVHMHEEEEDILMEPSSARNTNDSQNGGWVGTVRYWLGYST